MAKAAKLKKAEQTKLDRNDYRNNAHYPGDRQKPKLQIFPKKKRAKKAAVKKDAPAMVRGVGTKEAPPTSYGK